MAVFQTARGRSIRLTRSMLYWTSAYDNVSTNRALR